MFFKNKTSGSDPHLAGGGVAHNSHLHEPQDFSQASPRTRSLEAGQFCIIQGQKRESRQAKLIFDSVVEFP